MKVICNRAALAQAMDAVFAVAPDNLPRPILQCVKLIAQEDHLVIAATDSEIAIRYTDMLVHVEESGEAIVNAKKLRVVAQRCTGDTITLSASASANSLRVEGQDSSFELFGPDGDFPAVPDFEGKPSLEIPSRVLCRLIGQTVFAAAEESTRYTFNGILIESDKNRVRAVASNGCRMALAIGELYGHAPKKPMRAIVPVAALSLLKEILEREAQRPGELGEPIGIKLIDGRAFFRAAAFTIAAFTAEGEFPPYKEVIPKNCDKKLVVPTCDFLAAIRQVSPFCEIHCCTMRLGLSKSKATVSAQHHEYGRASVHFAARYEGADIEVGFNPQLLIDMLKIVNSDEILLELTEPNCPALLTAGRDFVYVLMPTRLNGGAA